MADICDLAYIFTADECDRRKIVIDKNRRNKDGSAYTVYTKKAQEVFDRYYDLITNTLKV